MLYRKGINFTKNIEKYEKKEKIFWYLRTTAVLITIGILILIGNIIYTNLRLNIQLKNLAEEKDRLFKLVVQNSARNKKLSEIAVKIKLMRKYLKENDAQFGKYYNLLSNFIEFDKDIPIATDEPTATESALTQNIRLDKMNINIEKKTSISFRTSNRDTYKTLLDLIENKEFLELFKDLQLSSISLEDTEEVQELKLNIEGKFKPE